MNAHIPDQLDQLSKKELLEVAQIMHETNVDLNAQLAKANERVAELERKEGRFDQYALESEVMRKALLNKDRNADDVSPRDLKDGLNKFAIEQKIESLEELHSFFLNEFDWKFPDDTHVKFTDVGAAVNARIAQLRKEQGE